MARIIPFTPDFTIENHGTIFLLNPQHRSACEWLAEHVDEDSLWSNGALAVEHRFISDVVNHLRDDGFVVR